MKDYTVEFRTNEGYLERTITARSEAEAVNAVLSVWPMARIVSVWEWK